MKTFEVREDLRVRRTRKLLWEALMAELSERPFEQITVREICERAMVHRTTFYKHYEDKYVLLDQGMRQMYDTLLADVNTLSALPSMKIRLLPLFASLSTWRNISNSTNSCCMGMASADSRSWSRTILQNILSSK